MVSRKLDLLLLSSSSPSPSSMARQTASDPGLLSKVNIPLSIYAWMKFGNNKYSLKVSHIENKSV